MGFQTGAQMGAVDFNQIVYGGTEEVRAPDDAVKAAALAGELYI